MKTHNYLYLQLQEEIAPYIQQTGIEIDAEFKKSRTKKKLNSIPNNPTSPDKLSMALNTLSFSTLLVGAKTNLEKATKLKITYDYDAIMLDNVCKKYNISFENFQEVMYFTAFFNTFPFAVLDDTSEEPIDFRKKEKYWDMFYKNFSDSYVTIQRKNNPYVVVTDEDISKAFMDYAKNHVINPSYIYHVTESNLTSFLANVPIDHTQQLDTVTQLKNTSTYNHPPLKDSMLSPLLPYTTVVPEVLKMLNSPEKVDRYVWP